MPTGHRAVAGPLLALLSLLLTPLRASAAPGDRDIHITFLGHVASVTCCLIDPPFVVGDPVNGTLVLDPSAADTDPDPNVGVYPSGIRAFDFTVGEYRGSAGASASVDVWNDLVIPGGLGDELVLGASVAGPGIETIVGPRAATRVLVQMNSLGGLDLSSDAFPTADEMNAVPLGFGGRLTFVGGFGAGWTVTDFLAVSQLEVAVDIRPGNDLNPINPVSRGVVPVAILGSEDFDVADVDATTLAFGPGAAPLAHANVPHVMDVNGDGFEDLLAQFAVQDAALQTGDVDACVTGELDDGTAIEGCDGVFLVRASCGIGFELALLMPALMGWHRRRHRGGGGHQPSAA